MVLFDSGLCTMNFFGAGPSLPEPEEHEKPDGENGVGRKKGAERPVREGAHPEFELKADERGFAAFMPSVERCAW